MSKTQTVPVRCEPTAFCDMPDQAAQVASAIAAATGRGVEGERVVAATPASPIPGPTARDAVAGMLLRLGWDDTAVDLATSNICVADAAGRIRRAYAWPSPSPTPPEDAACIAALEALATREACTVGHGVNDACAECAPGEQVEGAAPDRETLGRAVHEVWRRHGVLPVEWEEIGAQAQDVYRLIGERLFAMGVEHGRAHHDDGGIREVWALKAQLSGVMVALGGRDGESAVDAAVRVAGEAMSLKAEREEIQRQWEEQGARLHALEQQHEAHRDAIWEVKGILGAPSVESLKTHAEKVKDALFGAVAEARESKDALERAAKEREALRKRVAELEEENSKLYRAAQDAKREGRLEGQMEIDRLGKAHESACARARDARSAGAAEIRERAASLVLNWEPWEGLLKLAERIRELPIGDAGAATVEAKRPPLAAGQAWRDGKGRPIAIRPGAVDGLLQAVGPFGQIAVFCDGAAAPEEWSLDEPAATNPGGSEVEPPKPSRVEVGQVWRCVGIRGDLEVVEVLPTRARLTDGREGGSEPEQAPYGARMDAMLDLPQWTFVRWPVRSPADVRAAQDAGGGP
jgi:hypothetical protein